MQVARAVDALRQGRPVIIDGWSATAVETMRPPAPAKGFLLLTHARAQTLKIRLYTPDVVALPLAAKIEALQIRAIADPTADLATPMKGPFAPLRRKLPSAFAAAVKLAKLAGLLPAVIVQKQRATRSAVDVSVSDISSYDKLSAETLKLVTRARVPL